MNQRGLSVSNAIRCVAGRPLPLDAMLLGLGPVAEMLRVANDHCLARSESGAAMNGTINICNAMLRDKAEFRAIHA